MQVSPKFTATAIIFYPYVYLISLQDDGPIPTPIIGFFCAD